MLSAIFTFLGGSAFRMVWGELSAWFNKKLDHEHEIERMGLQAKLDQDAHVRQLENIQLQHNLGVQMVHVQSEADQERAAGDAFTEAMKNAFRPTGVRWVDAWNGIVRPSYATICAALWVAKVWAQGGVMDEWDTSLMAGIVGFFFADRHLGKRGK